MYRKLVAYHLLLVFLLCTFQVGIATHHCCGRLADTKYFFGTATVGCGMEDNSSPVSGKCQSKTFKKDCCKDKLAKFQFQQNFNASLLKLNLSSSFIFISTFSIESSFQLSSNFKEIFIPIPPPPKLSFLKESLSRLQVFRI